MPTLTTGFTPSLYKYTEVRSCAKGIRAVEAIYVEYCVFGLFAKTCQEALLEDVPCGTQSYR